jgi:hypothetical protein
VTRVTDLEEFSLHQIWRPYQRMKGYEDRLSKPPLDLDATAAALLERDKWSECVLSRIGRIGFTVPPYIKHPLADIIRAACASPPAKENLT